MNYAQLNTAYYCGKTHDISHFANVRNYASYCLGTIQARSELVR